MFSNTRLSHYMGRNVCFLRLVNHGGYTQDEVITEIRRFSLCNDRCESKAVSKG